MVTIKKILVPTDLSTGSVPAIGYASSLAKDRDAEVILLHLISMDSMKEHFTAGFGAGLALPAETGMSVQPRLDVGTVYEQKRQLALAFVQQKIGADLRKAVKFRPIVKIGKVVEEAIAVAKEEQCDLIVISSEGGRLRHLWGGSITERIVRHAPCPVLSMQPSAQIRTEKDQRVQVKLIDQWAA